MSVVALIREGTVNYALFLHVLGAMLLVGGLFSVALPIGMSWRRGWSPGLTRFGLRALPYGVLPAYILMRIGAEWTASEENVPDDATWLTIGYITADAGALLILVSIIIAAVGLRKLRSGGGAKLAGAAAIISTLLLAAYVIAVWAMSAKPS